MESKELSPPQATGVIGITDDGFPIVTGEHSCAYWQPGAGGLYETQECWYCRYADFRKTSQITLQKSICRNPRCRLTPADRIPDKAKNEGSDRYG